MLYQDTDVSDAEIVNTGPPSPPRKLSNGESANHLFQDTEVPYVGITITGPPSLYQKLKREESANLQIDRVID